MKKRLSDDIILKIKDNKIPQKVIIERVEKKFTELGIEHKSLTQSTLSKYINQSALIDWELEGIIIEVVDELIKETKKKYRSSALGVKQQNEVQIGENENSVIIYLYTDEQKQEFFETFRMYFDDEILTTNEEFANRLFEITTALELEYPFPLIEAVYHQDENLIWGNVKKSGNKNRERFYIKEIVHTNEKERIVALEKLIEDGEYFGLSNLSHIPEVIEGKFTVIWLDTNTNTEDGKLVLKKWGIVLSYPDDLE